MRILLEVSVKILHVPYIFFTGQHKVFCRGVAILIIVLSLLIQKSVFADDAVEFSAKKYGPFYLGMTVAEFSNVSGQKVEVIQADPNPARGIAFLSNERLGQWMPRLVVNENEGADFIFSCNKPKCHLAAIEYSPVTKDLDKLVAHITTKYGKPEKISESIREIAWSVDFNKSKIIVRYKTDRTVFSVMLSEKLKSGER